MTIHEHNPKGPIGVDADPARRPGIPMEREPKPVGAAHWQEPEQQRDPGNVLMRADLPALTPVFGTTLPPRGLSGLMRRAAYRMPDHHTKHWLMLLLADRVDVLEHRLRRALPFVPILAGAIGVALAMRPRRSRWRWIG